VTRGDEAVLALIRYMIIQAARDGELQLTGQSDYELRGNVIRLMQGLASSDWQPAIQSEHQPKIINAALRFLDEDEPDLAIVMYATAVEHWLNGMLEVGLKRRGEQLDQASERAPLETKLTTRWQELLGLEFPQVLRQSILELARARNNFVHYKWPMHSEQDHDAHREEVTAIAHDAPRIFAALDELEDTVVFNGERERLERVLDDLELLDVPGRGAAGNRSS
jgi:hypothetical protein